MTQQAVDRLSKWFQCNASKETVWSKTTKALASVGWKMPAVLKAKGQWLKDESFALVDPKKFADALPATESALKDMGWVQEKLHGIDRWILNTVNTQHSIHIDDHDTSGEPQAVLNYIVKAR